MSEAAKPRAVICSFIAHTAMKRDGWKYCWCCGKELLQTKTQPCRELKFSRCPKCGSENWIATSYGATCCSPGCDWRYNGDIYIEGKEPAK